MEITKENFDPICDYVCDTAARVDNSNSASREVHAAAKEFKEKSLELRQNFNQTNIPTAIAEVEQAADSALRVARSSGTPKELVHQIKDAHDKVREFKRHCIS